MNRAQKTWSAFRMFRPPYSLIRRWSRQESSNLPFENESTKEEVEVSWTPHFHIHRCHHLETTALSPRKENSNTLDAPPFRNLLPQRLRLSAENILAIFSDGRNAVFPRLLRKTEERRRRKSRRKFEFWKSENILIFTRNDAFCNFRFLFALLCPRSTKYFRIIFVRVRLAPFLALQSHAIEIFKIL